MSVKHIRPPPNVAKRHRHIWIRSKYARHGEVVPFSIPEGKTEAVAMLRNHEIWPKYVLDIGPGFGTWAKLLRAGWPESDWTAIEIYRPYIEKYRLEDFYDRVYLGNALTISRAGRSHELQRTFDLAIFGDVVEHLVKHEGVKMVNRYRWEWALISVPINYMDQGPYDGNVYETHLHHWYEAQMLEAFPVVDWWCGKDIGVFLLKRPS